MLKPSQLSRHHRQLTRQFPCQQDKLTTQLRKMQVAADDGQTGGKQNQPFSYVRGGKDHMKLIAKIHNNYTDLKSIVPVSSTENNRIIKNESKKMLSTQKYQGRSGISYLIEKSGIKEEQQEQQIRNRRTKNQQILNANQSFRQSAHPGKKHFYINKQTENEIQLNKPHNTTLKLKIDKDLHKQAQSKVLQNANHSKTSRTGYKNFEGEMLGYDKLIVKELCKAKKQEIEGSLSRPMIEKLGNKTQRHQRNSHRNDWNKSSFVIC